MLRTPSNRDEMFVDVGIYGVPGQERFDPDKSLRRIEEFVRNIGGFQMMYAESSLTRDEFRTMFDHSLYDRCVCGLQHNHLLIYIFRVREKLGCKGNLPEVYDKVNRRAKTGHFVLIL